MNAKTVLLSTAIAIIGAGSSAVMTLEMEKVLVGAFLIAIGCALLAYREWLKVK